MVYFCSLWASVKVQVDKNLIPWLDFYAEPADKTLPFYCFIQFLTLFNLHQAWSAVRWERAIKFKAACIYPVYSCWMPHTVDTWHGMSKFGVWLIFSQSQGNKQITESLPEVSVMLWVSSEAGCPHQYLYLHSRCCAASPACTGQTGTNTQELDLQYLSQNLTSFPSIPTFNASKHLWAAMPGDPGMLQGQWQEDFGPSKVATSLGQST